MFLQFNTVENLHRSNVNQHAGYSAAQEPHAKRYTAFLRQAKLEKLSLSDNDQAWGIACIGLRLWDEQFNLNFEWDEKVDSYKKQYFKVVEQIKNKQKNFR